MSEEFAEPLETDDETLEDEPTSARGPSLISRLGLVAVLALIVMVECVVAGFFLPDPAQTAQMAGVAVPVDIDFEPVDLGVLADPAAEAPEQKEIDLGQFTVTAYQPLTNTTARIDFHLYGTILPEDEEEFLAAKTAAEHRLRFQILVIARSAERDDLTDAGLGLIQRRILEKVNRTLGKPYLQTVLFSDFSFIEQ